MLHRTFSAALFAGSIAASLPAAAHFGLILPDPAMVLEQSKTAFKLDVSIGKEPLRKGCLGAHDLFGALTVSVGYLVVMRHALVHIGKLTLHFSRRAMEHHKHRRRAEGPAAAFVYADRNARHLRAGAAVQAAHCAYVVVA